MSYSFAPKDLESINKLSNALFVPFVLCSEILFFRHSWPQWFQFNASAMGVAIYGFIGCGAIISAWVINLVAGYVYHGVLRNWSTHFAVASVLMAWALLGLLPIGHSEASVDSITFLRFAALCWGLHFFSEPPNGASA